MLEESQSETYSARRDFEVTMAVFVPMACILIGACSLTISEKMAFVEGLYVAIVSVSTVGYGDKAFTTLWGRLIGALWLLFSVIVFTRVYDYVVDLFFRKKSWRVSKLCKEVTFEEMSKNGNIISEQDFMIHRLKELCDIREEEMQQLTDEYERMCKEMAKRNSNTAEAEV